MNNRINSLETVCPSYKKITEGIYVNQNVRLSKNDIENLGNLKKTLPKDFKLFLVEKNSTNEAVSFFIIWNGLKEIFYISKIDNVEINISLADIYKAFNTFKILIETAPSFSLILWDKYAKIKKYINYIKNRQIIFLSPQEIKKLIEIGIWLQLLKFKVVEYMNLQELKKENPNILKNIILYHIQYTSIRPIDLLYLKNLWELDNQDYQKYLPQVKELLKTQLTNEYYKIFLQIPNFFPFSHITQKELDFYAGKIKEYKANIPWIWKIVLKLDKPIISEEEYQEYSKKLSELKEKYLGETQQDILNLQEEIKFTSMNELIQAIREHKLKEFWQIKKEYGINKDKEKLRENILKLVKKHYKPYNKLSNEEKKIVEKLIIWVEVNSN